MDEGRERRTKYLMISSKQTQAVRGGDVDGLRGDILDSATRPAAAARPAAATRHAALADAAADVSGDGAADVSGAAGGDDVAGSSSSSSSHDRVHGPDVAEDQDHQDQQDRKSVV